ncbi:MAG: RNA methyltransferase [Ignavibacteriales bacterium]|nr:MAG: RNA methyltransferase [Ignavibacteriaceae bacterium]MBW7872755.1 RNA methyltransferase [Ignavibacteria bacterium]MCZ2143475.1 RNA methyltransferase [Ignavibacteriales bacterium]OQY76307.1 MAG: hypothetical protein B6D45_04030 [Ignavibacteriales bacterium UTCHB3]MBV6444352.1 23S rRNA (uridine(2479)-2'-O)-methyltransferase [Ignavibacteriaceae bacterium]
MISINELKHIAALKNKKFREAEGKFIVEGVKSVEEGVKSHFLCELILYRNDAKDNAEDIIKIAALKGIRTEELKNKEFERLSDTVNPQGVSGVFRVPKQKKVNTNSALLIYLDRINDPGNLGTILRTADWFGFREVLLSPGCADVFNPKVVRSSMGSLFRCNFRFPCGTQELAELKRAGYALLTTQVEGKDLEDIVPEGKTIIVFSNESRGVLHELEVLADGKIAISGAPGAESLNVAVAAGIVLNKFFQTGNKR